MRREVGTRRRVFACGAVMVANKSAYRIARAPELTRKADRRAIECNTRKLSLVFAPQFEAALGAIHVSNPVELKLRDAALRELRRIPRYIGTLRPLVCKKPSYRTITC